MLVTNMCSPFMHIMITQVNFNPNNFIIYRLRDAFAQFDSDGDGKLSRKEIEKAMGNMLSEADLDDLLTDLDGDGDGEVEWDEFLHAMKARMREPESIKALKEAFR